MEEKRYLTFALGKGRLAKKTLELFEKIGITCDEIRDPDTRKLIFVNEELGLRFFLAKGPDVPTYVEYGAADIGIVGKDTILEESRNIYEVLDLGFGKCKMCICGPESAAELLQHHEQIRVATKYPRIAKDYFYNKKHQTVEIIKQNLLGEASLKDIRESMGRVGYGYGVGMQIFMDPAAVGSKAPAGIFGWDGAAGSAVQMDTASATSFVFTMHVRNMGLVYSDVHPKLRDIIFSE